MPADTNPIRSPPYGTAVFYSGSSAVAFLTHCFTPYKMKSTTSAGGGQMQATFSSYAGPDPSERSATVLPEEICYTEKAL